MQTVTLPLSAYRPGKSAHETVAAEAAQNLFVTNGIDWPVSGDDTLIGWGRRGTREVSRRVDIWAGVSA